MRAGAASFRLEQGTLRRTFQKPRVPQTNRVSRIGHGAADDFSTADDGRHESQSILRCPTPTPVPTISELNN